MAKPSVNLFALLERSDAGNKRLGDLDAAAKKTAKREAAYPSTKDHIIRQNQLEKKAKAKKRAAARAKSAAGASSTDGNASKVQANGAKRGGYNSNNGSSRQQQSGATSGGYNNNNNGPSRKQQPCAAVKKVPAEGVKLPPAAVKAPPPPPATVQAPPPAPPSLCDVNEFPSLK